MEFGTGGSTIRALLASNAKVYSVDSSLEWIHRIQGYRYIRKMQKSRLQLFHVDIGKTGRWGWPVEDSSSHLFPAYSSRIFSNIKCDEIDTILIDGRFRVACALNTILYFAGNENIRIMLHDFKLRTKYHVLLEYLREEDAMGTLSIFSIKPLTDLFSVKANIEKYKYDPA